jgi:spectinomycin phosphotransferase
MMDEPRDLTQEALAAAMRRHYEIDVSGVVDWDEVIRAPKERDLMFLVGGIDARLIEPHETEWFFEGYGDVAVDPLALSYYRHAWAVQDVGGYGERVFLTFDIGEESRSHAARILLGLFDPGGIVELALASPD